MSISELGSDIADYSTDERIESRFNITDMPFSGWVVIQLSTSFLYPQIYELRTIPDKGSIAQSLNDAKINLFDRKPTKENSFIRLVKTVAIFAITTFAVPTFALAGVCYNGYMITKHLFTHLFTKKENESLDWTKIIPHLKNLGNDAAVISLIILPALLAEPSDSLMVSALFSMVIGASVFFPEKFYTLLFNSKKHFGLNENEVYGFSKSFALRKNFGIVSDDGKALLSWDPNKDKDIYLDPAFRTFCLTGFFGQVYKDQGFCFLNLINDLQQKIPENCQMDLSYPPTAKKIISFLERNRTELTQAEIDVELFQKKISSLEKEMDLIRNLILNSFINVNKGCKIGLDFPMPKQEWLQRTASFKKK